MTDHLWHCRPSDLGRAKYELVTTVRTHLGCQDDAFGCMGIAEDEEGQQVATRSLWIRF